MDTEIKEESKINSKRGLFWQGALFGLGFCLSAWIIYFIGLSVKSSYDAYKGKSGNKTELASSKCGGELDVEKDLLVSNVEKHTGQGYIYFTGLLMNKGQSSANNLQLEVDLFDNGKFVDQYSEYFYGNLKVGEQRFFKISCGSKEFPPAKHDTYKVRVLSN